MRVCGKRRVCVSNIFLCSAAAYACYIFFAIIFALKDIYGGGWRWREDV